MGVVIDFGGYKNRMMRARFYWRMTKCSYRELSSYIGINLEQAKRWELIFVKEKEKEKEDGQKR